MNRFLLICLLLVGNIVTAQNVGIGTTSPVSSAQLDVSSTSKGLLPPRMTYAQRNAIVDPVAGLIVYCIDCGPGQMQYYNGNSWMQMMMAPGSLPYTLPIVITSQVTSITPISAVSGGNITNDGGALVTARGVIWDTLPLPTVALITKTSDGTGSGIFSSNITGLISGKNYHVRAYATNTIGTAYGGDSSFRFGYSYLPNIDITDINGNVYPTITTSCGQTWTTKNLTVSKYSNGDPIPQVTDSITWGNTFTGAWCWYHNDSVNYWQYGKLYNWYAVHDPRGLAPAGWHIPTDAEWTNLVKCIDPATDLNCTSCNQSLIAGGAMKETGTLHWLAPNTGADNTSGFSALPSGYRNFEYGGFFFLGQNTSWWCTDEYDASDAYERSINYNTANVWRDVYFKLAGKSIRLVKN